MKQARITCDLECNPTAKHCSLQGLDNPPLLFVAHGREQSQESVKSSVGYHTRLVGWIQCVARMTNGFLIISSAKEIS